jgi:hypothetical protein
LKQEFKQELYQPFDELEVPVDIVSSEDEPEVPVDFERVDEDIERCASTMAMDLCPVASLPAVPSDGDEVVMSSPNKKAMAWSPHDLGGPGLNFGPGSPPRSSNNAKIEPKAPPMQAAPIVNTEPESASA